MMTDRERQALAVRGFIMRGHNSYPKGTSQPLPRWLAKQMLHEVNRGPTQAEVAAFIQRRGWQKQEPEPAPTQADAAA